MSYPPVIAVYVAISGKTYFPLSLDWDSSSLIGDFIKTYTIENDVAGNDNSNIFVKIFAGSLFANGYYMIVVVY